MPATAARVTRTGSDLLDHLQSSICLNLLRVSATWFQARPLPSHAAAEVGTHQELSTQPDKRPCTRHAGSTPGSRRTCRGTWRSCRRTPSPAPPPSTRRSSPRCATLRHPPLTVPAFRPHLVCISLRGTRAWSMKCRVSACIPAPAAPPSKNMQPC